MCVGLQFYLVRFVKHVVVYLLLVIIYSGEEKQILVMCILLYEADLFVFVFILFVLTG